MSETTIMAPADLADALAMEIAGPTADVTVDATTVRTHVHDGYDVFGIPHGGYLGALAARAMLLVSDEPDLFTVTVHFMRKAAVGPMEVQVARIGGSRRFATWHAIALQGGSPVLTALASVGDRTGIDGPSWTDTVAWDPAGDHLSRRAGDPAQRFTTPRIAEPFGMRIALPTAGFVTGRLGDEARLRATVEIDEPDQLVALIACDLTPPAAWNVLGPSGWVPTVELTAHLRARPSPGRLTVEVDTHHVQDGFLEEDAIVRDSTGKVVAQSRQLARWSG